jgi:adenylylsulfate kinase
VTAAHGFTLWFTGLSGAGKSTLSQAIADELRRRGRRVERLDGDEVRQRLSRGLGFSKEDRDENIRRIGYVARLLSRNGAVAIASAISPYRAVRDEIRREHDAPFIEVFVDCPLDALLKRDPKGLYAKAVRGEIAHFSGISDPYEPPRSPEITIHTDRESVDASRDAILGWLEARKLM